jgi:uracil-DNA glycosylase
MSRSLSPDLRRALAERIHFYNELGIYDFYRREPCAAGAPDSALAASAMSPATPISIQPEQREEMSPRKAAVAVPVATDETMLEIIASRPEAGVADPVKALKLIREDLGDCTRCRLAKQGRKQIVFGV